MLTRIKIEQEIMNKVLAIQKEMVPKNEASRAQINGITNMKATLAIIILLILSRLVILLAIKSISTIKPPHNPPRANADEQRFKPFCKSTMYL
jgi:hypothetical protein